MYHIKIITSGNQPADQALLGSSPITLKNENLLPIHFMNASTLNLFNTSIRSNSRPRKRKRSLKKKL